MVLPHLRSNCRRYNRQADPCLGFHRSSHVATVSLISSPILGIYNNGDTWEEPRHLHPGSAIAIGYWASALITMTHDPLVN